MKKPRTIICTIGTSIANSCPSIRSYQSRSTTWDEDCSGLKMEIRDRVAKGMETREGLMNLSAEIHSLYRLGCGQQDEVVLLTSDTAEGRACQELIHETLTKIFSPSNIHIHRVPGLQASNGELMRKEGIPNFLSQVCFYVQDPQRRHETEIVLNPTGGFKGIVPFMTVLGMLYGVKVVYLYEFSKELICLPPLPVTLDYELFERSRLALKWAQSVAVFTPQHFYSFIDGYVSTEEDLFAGFLESDGSGKATLSPLALVLLEEESTREDYIMISKRVKDWLDSMQQNERGRYEKLACRLSSPLGRRNQRKAFHGTNLEVYGRSSFAARFAGYTQGSVFYLCLAEKVSSHNQYEETFGQFNRGDFEDREVFQRLDFPSGSDFEDLEQLEVRETWMDLRDERDRLRIEIERLRKTSKNR